MQYNKLSGTLYTGQQTRSRLTPIFVWIAISKRIVQNNYHFWLPVSECICVSPIKHCGCHASLSHRKLSWRSRNLYVYIIHLFVMFAVGLLCVHVILLYLYLLSFGHLNSTKKYADCVERPSCVCFLSFLCRLARAHVISAVRVL